jgi:molybdopterin-binding protein
MLSARHHLLGTVKLVNLGANTAKVIVTVGQFEIVTAITRGSVESLRLKVGGRVKVVIKVTEVLVEPPRRGKGRDADGSRNAQLARCTMRQSPNLSRVNLTAFSPDSHRPTKNVRVYHFASRGHGNCSCLLQSNDRFPHRNPLQPGPPPVLRSASGSRQATDAGCRRPEKSPICYFLVGEPSLRCPVH